MNKKQQKILWFSLGIVAILFLVFSQNSNLFAVIVKNSCLINEVDETIVCPITDRTLTSLYGKGIIALNLGNQPYEREYFTNGLPVNNAVIDGNYYSNDRLPAIINVSAVTRNGYTVSTLGFCDKVIDDNGVHRLICDGTGLFNIFVDSSGNLVQSGESVGSDSNIKNFVVYTRVGGFNSLNNFCTMNEELSCDGKTLYKCESHIKVSLGLVQGQCGYTTLPTGTEDEEEPIYIGENPNSEILNKSLIPSIFLGAIILIIIVVVLVKRKR